MKVRLAIAVMSLALSACTAESEQGKTKEKAGSRGVQILAGDEDCGQINAETARKADAINANGNLSDVEREIALTRIYRTTGQCGMRPVPPGTPDPPDISDELAGVYRDAVETARRFGADDGECRKLVGSSKADALEAICLQVSGVTHPNCSAANSCDHMVEEVDTSCSGYLREHYPKLCSASRPLD